ncbi:MAG: 4Fe-4S dicluster domain-containing protein [Planctomycetaceae bacterium]|nr:4Fe-4S dicluster domain-containing protein [Planctomycetaceae bacterium]
MTNHPTTESHAPVPSPTGDAGSLGHTIAYDRFLDCVHCGLCTSACPTYLETGNENDSPRGRIYLMRAVTDGRLAMTEKVERHLDLCLDCRSCETACPSGVQYGRLIEPFRVELQQTKAAAGESKSSWLQRLILYRLFPYPGRLKLALGFARLTQRLGLDRLAERMGLVKLLPQFPRRMHRLLPRLEKRPPRLPEVLPAKGKRRARVALFTGCVSEAMFGETNAATARVLQENGCEVVIPRNQKCCGAIHYHSGEADPALRFAADNATAFPQDVDAVIVNVAGCGSMLKDYGHVAEELDCDRIMQDKLNAFAGRVQDVSEFLAELGPIGPQGEIPLRATYHDACHLAHAQKVTAPPRQLLSLIPGLQLVPLPESAICCGAAGSYNLTEPEMADQLGNRKMQNILKTQADVVIMGNVGCALQIQAQLREAGQPISVMHPMDILDLSYRGLQPKNHSQPN